MELSIVVPTYNQADLLAECLQSLGDQTLPSEAYEIVVVDDGSTDHTGAVLDAFQASFLRSARVRFPVNRGRSAARNAGIARAVGPLILFVDSDVVVRRDFLEWHLRTHQRTGPGILSRGPVVLVPNPSLARSGQIPRFATSPAYLDTANAAVEKAVLLRAGLFDEAFSAYGWEDFELGVRLKRLGIRRVFCRQAVAFHVQPQALWEGIDRLLRKEEERARSAVYFYRKHPTLETRLLIQATPVHRVLYWLFAGCGLLRPDNVVAVMRRMRTVGLNGIAYLGLRGVLNRHYVYTLAAEFRRHAATLA